MDQQSPAAAEDGTKAVLEICETNEFDANLASIEHAATRQGDEDEDFNAPAAVDYKMSSKPNLINTKAEAGFTSQMSQVKQGLASVVNVTLPS